MSARAFYGIGHGETALAELPSTGRASDGTKTGKSVVRQNNFVAVRLEPRCRPADSFPERGRVIGFVGRIGRDAIDHQAVVRDGRSVGVSGRLVSASAEITEQRRRIEM